MHVDTPRKDFSRDASREGAISEDLWAFLEDYDDLLQGGGDQVLEQVIEVATGRGFDPQLVGRLARDRMELLCRARLALAGHGQVGSVQETIVGHSGTAVSPQAAPLDPAEPRFRKVRVLGRGGEGVVWLADEAALNRLVAIKCPKSGDAASAWADGAFRREAQIAARLKHEGIVAIHQLDLGGQFPQIVMSYCEGGDLLEWLRAQPGPVDDLTAARIGVEIAEALHYAHQSGITHRDLKLRNILLAAREAVEPNQRPPIVTSAEELLSTWRLKISDFGLASMARDPREGRIGGTLPSMAPEQLGMINSPLGPATDIWAMGVLLRELTTQSSPFAGRTRSEVIESIRGAQESARRPSEMESPAAPASPLESIITRCLQVAPEQRYATAKELADALRSILPGAIPPAAPPPPDRSRLWIALAAAACCVLALVLFRPANHEEPNRAQAEGIEPQPVNQNQVRNEFRREFGEAPRDLAMLDDRVDRQIGRVGYDPDFRFFRPEESKPQEGALVLVAAGGTRFHQLVEDPGSDFILHVSIGQDRWKGAAGVFLGFDRRVQPGEHGGDKRNGGQPQLRPMAHTISIERDVTPEGLIEYFICRWVRTLAPPALNMGPSPIGRAQIPNPYSCEFPELAVRVQGGELVDVQWAGVSYPELVGKEAGQLYSDFKLPLNQKVGVFIDYTEQTWFYNPRFKLLKPGQPKVGGRRPLLE